MSAHFGTVLILFISLLTTPLCRAMDMAWNGDTGDYRSGAIAIPKNAGILCLLTLWASALAGCGAGIDSEASSAPPTSPTAPTAPTSKSIWVAAWADAPDGVGGGASAEQTIREIVKPTVGSRGTVRLHFSNYFGTAPITVGAAHVGVQTTGAGVTSDVAVTFGGAASVTIPAGGFVTSDQAALTFNYGSTLAITEYVSGSWAGLTQHVQAGGVTSYATAASAGNKTSDIAGTSFTQTTGETYLLDRVEVYGAYTGTVAAFGSSTTDGLNSGVDQHMTYPEQLAAALHTAGRDDVGIANVGIVGTQVLAGGVVAGVNRFGRDVLGQPSLTAVIDYLGANDLRASCVTAAALIAGRLNIIAQARAAGVKIYEATTAPSTYCGGQNPGGYGTRYAQGSGEEAQRFLLNVWDATTAASTVNGLTVKPPSVDAVIDFNGALADPANLSYMLPKFDSGDDIHPNAAGYGAMVKAIPLTLF